MRQLCEAVSHIHAQGIIHRDIKPDNILYNTESGDIKLIDFGLAKNLNKVDENDKSTRLMVGTPLFYAPEMIKENGSFDCYQKPVDIWAIGITCYYLLSGSFPYRGNDMDDLYD